MNIPHEQFASMSNGLKLLEKKCKELKEDKKRLLETCKKAKKTIYMNLAGHRSLDDKDVLDLLEQEINKAEGK